MTESRTRTETGFSENTVAEPTGVSGEGATRAGTADPEAGPRTVPGNRTDHDVPVVASGSSRRDRVRWGPVWAGLIVAVPTFLLLQVATLALGWWDVGPGDGASNADWLSGVNGLIALFLGGLTAGATALWRGFAEGLLHGILVWALTVVTLVVLTLFGGGALFGSLAGVVTDVAGIQQANLPDIAAGEAADVARTSAAWASLGLGLSIAAAALGGVIGAKMWPGKKATEADTSTVR
ncbi:MULTISPECIES: permease [unclassified Modestobacter]